MGVAGEKRRASSRAEETSGMTWQFYLTLFSNKGEALRFVIDQRELVVEVR
jgi:hypothetical protein